TDNTDDVESKVISQARKEFDQGELDHHNRRFEKALKHYKKARELDPENNRYLFKVAASYHNTGQIKDAVDSYTELIGRLEGKPFEERLVHAIAFKGGNLAILKRFEEAEALIDRALEMDSVSVVGLAMKGELLIELGRQSEAREYIQHAIEIEPDNKIALALKKRAE
ncbi:MAG: tetratricopeptide repeat protein, partial [candidate division Zixibacteria bacterium]|nr:tetratricopeptide repeat protein [candidate division Zixibacteria bacterium]